MKLTEKDIQGLLRGSGAEPSKAWREGTIARLRFVSDERTGLSFNVNGGAAYNLFSNFFAMKKVLSFVAVVAIVLVAGLYYNSPQNAFVRHMSGARAALDDLRAYTQGESFVVDSLLLTAYAEDAVSDDEAVVEELVVTLEGELDAAIEVAEDFEAVGDVVEALEEIDVAQDETVEVLGDVVELVESEEVVDAVVAVIEDTVEENEEVEAALVDAVEALESGEETVVVDVETDADVAAEGDGEEDGVEDEDGEEEDGDEDGVEEEEEPGRKELQAAKRLGEAEALVGGLDESVELTPSMQKKYDAIQEILAACESGEGKCNSGKAKGLATALDAKVRNEARKNAKSGGDDEDEDEDEGDEDEDESDGEDAGESEGDEVEDEGDGDGVEGDEDEVDDPAVEDDVADEVEDGEEVDDGAADVEVEGAVEVEAVDVQGADVEKENKNSKPSLTGDRKGKKEK